MTITTDEIFDRMATLYPDQTARAIAELRADKAEARVRELEQATDPRDTEAHDG